MNETASTVFKSELSVLTEGLLYSSESDRPFEIVSYTNASASQNLLQELSLPLDTPIREVTVEKFFENLTKNEDWHGDEEKAKVAKYTQLQNFLKTNLTDVRVYRVGETEVGIYIVGKSSDGMWTGLRTYSVET